MPFIAGRISRHHADCAPLSGGLFIFRAEGGAMQDAPIICEIKAALIALPVISLAIWDTLGAPPMP